MKKNDSKSPLHDADRVVDMGACSEAPFRHVALMKEGKVIGNGRVLKCEEGKPLPTDTDIVMCDGHGKIVDRMRIDGPAQVASPSYRQNYDSVFGKKRPSKELN